MVADFRVKISEIGLLTYIHRFVIPKRSIQYRKQKPICKMEASLLCGAGYTLRSATHF